MYKENFAQKLKKREAIQDSHKKKLQKKLK